MAKRKTAPRKTAARKTAARKTAAKQASKAKKGSQKRPVAKQKPIPTAVVEKVASKAPRKLAAKKPSKSAQRDASVSTHKARASWFHAREAWPAREAPMHLLMQARATAKQCVPQAPGTAKWDLAGPSNVGGRSTSIVFDPADPDRIWLGAAGGGVWFSPDGGLSWTSQWHDEPSLNIGSLCLDPSNSDRIYCGTGEANLSADSHAGVGIYLSNNGGTDWELLASAEAHGLPRRIGRITVDPFDPDRIYIAGVGHTAQDATGLFVSTDRGISWARVHGIFPGPFRCHEIAFHPTVAGTIFATIDASGSSNGIWMSRDQGLTWEHLTSGLPTPSHCGRISLAFAGDATALYAQIASHNGAVLGIYRSANAGQTWKSVGGNHFGEERQMNYNNTISVDPSDANVVVCAGVDIHRSKNGGNTWKKLTRWDARRHTDSDYAHADHHCIVHTPASDGRIYAANDGGLDVSFDGGDTWKNRSAGLATNMFYDIASAASDGDVFGGGMQDNGTWLTFDGQPDGFYETTGGDGGFCAIDPNDRLHLFTSSQGMRINRHRASDGWRTNTGPNETGSRPWMAFIAMDPDRPKRIFVASWRVWRSTNDGTSWSSVTGNLDGSFVSCIEISRADTDHIYVGTENGGIFKSEDGGATWTGNIATSLLPGRTITRLRTPSGDANIVYATVANFGSSHLFRSTDGGNTWRDVDNGSLPDVPHHGIVIPDGDPDRIYVCNDAGVFTSADGASTWKNLTGNLPTVMVIDLVLHEATQTLFAATYGRSIWRTNLSH